MPKVLAAQGQAMGSWNASCEAGLVPQPCSGVQHRSSWALAVGAPTFWWVENTLFGQFLNHPKKQLQSRSREPQNGKKNQLKFSLQQVRKDDKFQLSEKLTQEAELCFMCRIGLSIQTVKVPTKQIPTCCFWMHKLGTTWLQQSIQDPKPGSQFPQADRARRCFMNVQSHRLTVQAQKLNSITPFSATPCSPLHTKTRYRQRCPEKSTWQTAPGWYPARSSAWSAHLLKISVGI